jgi:hypothetical protein
MTEQIFYTYDNLHDLLNEINLGNGLAYLLRYHSNSNSSLSHMIYVFIEYANQKLRKETSTKEINTLLKYHHPKYRCSDEVKDYLFQLDEKGNISLKDPNLKRIVQIRNAYVITYNTMNQKKLPLLTVKEAREKVVFQKLILENSYGSFEVLDIISTDVMLKDDTKEYNSSLISGPFLQTIICLIAFTNHLYYDRREGLFKAKLLDKYFNNKNEDYPQGSEVGFYLGNRRRSYYPKISRMNFTSSPWETIVKKTSGIIRKDFSNLDVKKPGENISELELLAENYAVMHMPGLTFFESCFRNGFLSIYLKEESNKPSLLKTCLAYFWNAYYRIPENLLNDKYKSLLDPKYRDNKIIREKIRTIIRHMVDISAIYDIYGKE